MLNGRIAVRWVEIFDNFYKMLCYVMLRFFCYFEPPISDVFLASTNAMETIVHEPRSGEPIFLLFWTPVSDVFLASTNAMETIVHEPRSGEPIFFCYFEPP